MFCEVWQLLMFGLHRSCGTTICRSRGGACSTTRWWKCLRRSQERHTLTSSVIGCALLKTILTATDSSHRCNPMSWEITVILRSTLLRRHFFGLQGTQWMQNSAKRRFVYTNAWRNITTNTIENNFLAVCNETALVSSDDYLASDLFIPGTRLMQYGLSDHNAAKHSLVLLPEDADG